jgi:hypothetical protein
MNQSAVDKIKLRIVALPEQLQGKEADGLPANPTSRKGSEK